MAKYTWTCEQGHEPKSFTVEAENDDEAVEKLMEETKGHVDEDHKDMEDMSPEEAKKMITSSWKKEE